MNPRTRAFVCAVVAGAAVCLYSVRQYPNQQWVHFFIYLAAILLSSGMKVAMPKSDATMSVNFPFILLGIVQLSPLQAVALVAASVIALCRIKVIRGFTLLQIVFNLANATIATVLACDAFHWSLRMVRQETGPALAIAATVYFLANTLCFVAVQALDSGTSPLSDWFREFPWYFPFYIAGAALAAVADFIGNRFGWLTSMLLIPVVYALYRAYRAHTDIVRDREQHIAEIEGLQLRTIEGLAMAIEAKDRNTHRHLMRVRVYVSELGKLIGLDPIQMQALIAASYLHDIGKLAVPEHIINKPGKLTREEFEKMKIHPVVGAEILERVRFPYPVVPIVRSHHEAWDGSGYPDGLKGEEIPIGARILTAVDCLDALASERPYRKAMPLDDAMAFVKEKAGSLLDPHVVGLLEQHYHELESRARQAIEEVPPLNTDMFIERGRAPGAGFQPDPTDGVPLGSIGSDEQCAPATGMVSAIAGAAGSIRAEIADGCWDALAVDSAGLSLWLTTLIPSDCVAVYRKSDSCLRAEWLAGPCEEAFSDKPIPIGGGLSGWVAEYGLPVLNGNPTVEPNLETGTGLFTPDSSAISAPLRDKDGSLLGVVTFYSRQHGAYAKEQLTLLKQVGPQLVQFLKTTHHGQQQDAEQGPSIDPGSHLLKSFAPMP